MKKRNINNVGKKEEGKKNRGKISNVRKKVKRVKKNEPQT
jgi:hypothetical protein